MLKSSLKTFFESEIAVGISLLGATIFALFIANYGEFEVYQQFLEINLSLNFSYIGFHKNLSLHDWINEGLMAVFFLLVGLELKREVLVGELSSRKKFLLPAIAALGGIIFPALIFIFCNLDNEENWRGFAIPCATDIAFAYGAISLFGKRISNSLKVFLVALAVLDDLAAIMIIAVFYSDNLHFGYLALASIIICILCVLNFRRCKKTLLYLLCGAFLWLAILKSGINPTLAGVLVAMFIPLEIDKEPMLLKLAHRIAPMVNFLILPIFAFANAGVRIENFSEQSLKNPLVVGVVAGLFLGKQFGVMLSSLLAVGLKICHLPRGSSWLGFYGASILTGIGFTMSLFIGSLAFLEDSSAFDQVKIAVLIASFLSAIFGIFVTYLATKKYEK